MDKVCQNCKYFKRHYYARNKSYVETGVGHCEYPKVRLVDECRPACKCFERCK